jgi:hypothetical protein
VGLVLLLLIILWLVISGSGLLPGDTGVEPVADPAEGQTGQLMNLAAWPWTVILLLGTIVLGVGIAWGQFRSGQVTEAENDRTEAATRALHERERDPDYKD